MHPPRGDSSRVRRVHAACLRAAALAAGAVALHAGSYASAQTFTRTTPGGTAPNRWTTLDGETGRTGAGPGAPSVTTRCAEAPVACCFPDTLTPEQLDEAMKTWGLLPPWNIIAGGADYFLDSLAWVGQGALQDLGQATRADLTYSFPPDGTAWGALAYTQGPCDFQAALAGAFGPGNADLGFEYVRAAIAAYRVAGLTFREVTDDSAPWGTPDPSAPFRGDIRIGGLPGGAVFLGYSSYPAGGADIAINTGVFTWGNLGSNADDYRALRQTISHEMGHALGLAHTVPCDRTKLMEPVLNTTIDGLSIDEVRGAHRNYGDRLSGNGSSEFAHDLGNLTSPGPRGVRFESLSTNGTLAHYNGTDRDWFRFRLSTAQTVHITVDQRGGTYTSARQDVNCTPAGGVAPVIIAQSAGALALQLRDGFGANIIATAPGMPGTPQRIDQFLIPGEYSVLVRDMGPNDPVNQRVQMYDFAISAGVSPTAPPPLAIAGVGKRVRANTYAFFLGNIHSRARAPGATLSTGSYEWDLDGDGTFERSASPRPSRQYYSNGEYAVTLRVTDSNGQSATDTIPVVVYGAQTIIALAFPSAAPRFSTTPITLFGANFKNVMSASEVTVSGFGVSVIGTPVSNPDGTVLTGLSVVVAPGAALGPRTIFIQNFDGQGVGVDLLTVAPANACGGDANGDRVVDFLDLNIVVSQYGAVGVGIEADFNADGVVDFLDLNILLANFGLNC